MTDDARLRAACHETGHACMAWLMGKLVVLISLDGPPMGGPVCIDREPVEPLNGRRRPAPLWHSFSDEVLICLAGGMCEGLADEYDEPQAPVMSGRVPDPAPLAVVPSAVGWQDADEERPWPARPLCDADQAAVLLTAITTSDEEHEALSLALRLRCEAVIRTRHFADLHRHLTAALMREGELYARQVKTELERAELRHLRGHLTTTIPEDTDG